MILCGVQRYKVFSYLTIFRFPFLFLSLLFLFFAQKGKHEQRANSSRHFYMITLEVAANRSQYIQLNDMAGASAKKGVQDPERSYTPKIFFCTLLVAGAHEVGISHFVLTFIRTTVAYDGNGAAVLKAMCRNEVLEQLLGTALF